MKKIIFSQELNNQIIELYKNNNSLKAIGEKFLVNRNVIKRILEENNIELRKKTTKYQTNTSIFHKIDSNEKAYWLGYIAADGCNYRRKDNATIIINIHQKDIEQLLKFKIFCNSNALIISYITSAGYSNNTPMCKLSINSIEMSDDLTNIGVPPRKSLILKPPIINEKYYLSYILGYFDGDGSISKTNCYNNYEISIVGTKEILEWINNILQIDAKLEKRNNDNTNNYYIRCGGTNKPYLILKKLYNSCDIHLERKYKLYKNLETVVLNRNIL